MVGVFVVRGFGRLEPEVTLRVVTYVSTVLMLAGTYVAIESFGMARSIFWAILAGAAAGVAIGRLTEFYTSGSPIVRIAEASRTGAATNVITGWRWRWRARPYRYWLSAAAFTSRIPWPASTGSGSPR